MNLFRSLFLAFCALISAGPAFALAAPIFTSDNPQGQHGCTEINQIAFDTTNEYTYVCTVAGAAGVAQWQQVGVSRLRRQCAKAQLTAAPTDENCLNLSDATGLVNTCDGETAWAIVHNASGDAFDELRLVFGDTSGLEDAPTDDWAFTVYVCAEGENPATASASCTTVGSLTNAEIFAQISGQAGTNPQIAVETLTTSISDDLAIVIIHYNETTDGGVAFDPDMGAEVCWYESRD
jgi:hypothetical protein